MMHFSAEIKGIRRSGGGVEICLRADQAVAGVINTRMAGQVEIGVDDGRTISPLQRRKIYATLRDISEHTGYDVESAKQIMKVEHMMLCEDPEDFSLSDCSVTQAREFINTLLEYALKEGIILTQSGLERTDDIDTYLIQCIRHRKCCICGQQADIHHVDAIGMGADRSMVEDSGKRIVALCRKHHTYAHQKGWLNFSRDYKVYGIEKYRTEI